MFTHSHSQVSMVIADGLAPDRRQVIGNHHDDIDRPTYILSTSTQCQTMMTSWHGHTWGILWVLVDSQQKGQKISALMASSFLAWIRFRTSGRSGRRIGLLNAYVTSRLCITIRPEESPSWLMLIHTYSHTPYIHPRLTDIKIIRRILYRNHMRPRAI